MNNSCINNKICLGLFAANVQPQRQGRDRERDVQQRAFCSKEPLYTVCPLYQVSFRCAMKTTDMFITVMYCHAETEDITCCHL